MGEGEEGGARRDGTGAKKWEVSAVAEKFPTVTTPAGNIADAKKVLGKGAAASEATSRWHGEGSRAGGLGKKFPRSRRREDPQRWGCQQK